MNDAGLLDCWTVLLLLVVVVEEKTMVSLNLVASLGSCSTKGRNSFQQDRLRT